MTKYASSDITLVVNANCPTGGHRREITNPKEVAKGEAPEYGDEFLTVTCAACEPVLLGKDSWSGDPTTRPLTKAEIAEQDRLEKLGMRQQALASQALAELAYERVAQNAAASKPKRAAASR